MPREMKSMVENGYCGIHEIRTKYLNSRGIVLRLALLKFTNGNQVVRYMNIPENGLYSDYMYLHLGLALERVGKTSPSSTTTIRGTGLSGVEDVLFTYSNIQLLKGAIQRACDRAKKERGNILSIQGGNVTTIPPTLKGFIKKP